MSKTKSSKKKVESYKKYIVTVSEVRTFVVEASSEEEARENVFDGEEIAIGDGGFEFLDIEEVQL
jgi:hypothetical protein